MGTDVGPACVRGDPRGASVYAWGRRVCMGTAYVRGDGVCAWGLAWGRGLLSPWAQDR